MGRVGRTLLSAALDFGMLVSYIFDIKVKKADKSVRFTPTCRSPEPDHV